MTQIQIMAEDRPPSENLFSVQHLFLSGRFGTPYIFLPKCIVCTYGLVLWLRNWSQSAYKNERKLKKKIKPFFDEVIYCWV